MALAMLERHITSPFLMFKPLFITINKAYEKFIQLPSMFWSVVWFTVKYWPRVPLDRQSSNQVMRTLKELTPGNMSFNDKHHCVKPSESG